MVNEFGSWSRAERDELLRVGRAAGATVELHILDPPPDELWRRLAERKTQPGQTVIDRSSAGCAVATAAMTDGPNL